MPTALSNPTPAKRSEPVSLYRGDGASPADVLASLLNIDLDTPPEMEAEQNELQDQSDSKAIDEAIGT